MAFNYLDVHTAKKKMALKNASSCFSFVSTLWRGEVIMCCFNNLSKDISRLYCTQRIDPEDVTQLEALICEFIYGG